MQFCDVWSCKIAELARAILQRHQTSLHYCNFATSRPGLLLRASARQRRFAQPFLPIPTRLAPAVAANWLWLCANPCRFNSHALNRAHILFSSKQREELNIGTKMIGIYYALTKLYQMQHEKLYNSYSIKHFSFTLSQYIQR